MPHSIIEEEGAMPEILQKNSQEQPGDDTRFSRPPCHYSCDQESFQEYSLSLVPEQGNG